MTTRPEAGELAAAVEGADLRVLLMCLVHLTGDLSWLDPPYRPVRDVRLIADPTAGLPPDAQRAIRRAAAELLRDGVPEPALPHLDDALLGRMMRTCLGETVDPEYVGMMREDMGFARADPAWSGPDGQARAHGVQVLIVGAGAAGLAMAAALARLGVPYTVVEKNDDVGGTWYENRYPGVRVDTPNHFYSYSFAPVHPWPEYFSRGDAVEAYLQGFADSFGIRPHIRFGTELTAATWDEQAQRWRATLRLADGSVEHVDAPVLVSAIGHLNKPQYPDLAGLDAFAGPVFHSARWRDDVDLAGKRVAVIGTGATAMQLVPAIADEVAALTVYQRSPQWSRPVAEYDQAVTPALQWLIRNLPYYATWFRFTLFWRYGDGLLRHLQKDPDWPHPDRSLNRANDRHRQELTDYIVAELGDRDDLVTKCVPAYPPYGKRMLIDNGWFRTLRLSHVELVTDSIDHVEPHAVVTVDGERRPADVIVLATGFTITDLTARLGVTGRSGRTLAESWVDDNPAAYLGITVPGFPNLFCMYGPNTNLGHGGSMVFMAECQARYISSCLVQMAERGVGAIDCRPEVLDEFVHRVDEAHERMIWTHRGMSTWYRNARGRVISTFPFRLVDYWAMTHDADLDDYVTTPAS